MGFRVEISAQMGGLPRISRRKDRKQAQIGAAGNNGEHRAHRSHLLIGGLPRIPDHSGGLPRISAEFEDFLVFRWASEYEIVGFRV